ncbi:MAG: MMPL family transporter [Legionellaceae bacterium]|nr:MMPL family transporter [Legionellaceae bacterium]
MDSKLFYRLGLFTYRFRREIIAFWIACLFICIPHLSDIINPFQSTGFIATNSRSDLNDKFLNKNLGYGNNQFLVIYHSDTLKADNPKYIKKIKYSLSGLKKFPVEHNIILPENSPKQISKDGHTAFAVILFKKNQALERKLIDEFQETIVTPKGMSVHLGGEPIFVEHINEQTQRDLYKADFIAAPVTIITLLVVFKTVVAAFVPLYIGASSALLILTMLYALGHLFDLSIFTLNIALLLGLCLSLDYALFLIYRFRDELNSSTHIKDTIGKTMATAGKAIFYSGIAVFISLSALLMFPINILFSIGVGGLVAVFVAVSAALTLLPAILCVLKDKINSLAIRPVQKQTSNPNDNDCTKGIWYRLAKTVTSYPGAFSLATLFFVSILSYTMLNIKIGISDFNVLPDHSENQKFFDMYKENFNKEGLVPIKVIIKTDTGKITSAQNIKKVYDYIDKLKGFDAIEEVNSIVSIDNRLKLQQYQYMYSNKDNVDKNIKILLDRTTRDKFTVASVISKYGPNSLKTKELIEKIENTKPGPGLTISLAGIPVTNVDVVSTIMHSLPYAAVWIICLTYIILLILLRSLFLPLQAIFMNILSLCASYGVLVFIFQEGYLHELLHFRPQGMLDISLIIIIFCALFGFSMDYEVFLLTRIHEAYSTTKDNVKSIIFGIVKSSRIITSAALIVILLCGSFMFADVLMVKEFGLGIAVAIFVDAFAIRTILVPATMALANSWNWYLPKWMDKSIRKK